MRSTDTPLAAAVTTLAVAHSKMGVGKKIRRILSFKKKKEEKPAIEAPKADKTNTLNGTKKSSSLISLSRKFSFGRGDKTKKDRSKKGAPPAPEAAVPLTAASPETIAPVPLAAPEIIESVPAVETSEPKIQILTETALQNIDIVSNENAVEQLSERENSLFEKMKSHVKEEDIKDEGACSDGAELTAGRTDSLSEEQPQRPAAAFIGSENHCEIFSTAAAPTVQEPKTITEVINKIHDKSETNQTGDEFVRTVEVEQERTLAEDGTTVISRSTKTTTTTVDRGSVGNVSQVKTEIKREVMPRVFNGKSRQISQLSDPKSSMLSMQSFFAFITVALICAILYKVKDFGALSLV